MVYLGFFRIGAIQIERENLLQIPHQQALRLAAQVVFFASQRPRLIRSEVLAGALLKALGIGAHLLLALPHVSCRDEPNLCGGPGKLPRI